MFWALCGEVGRWTGWRSWLCQLPAPPHHWELSWSSDVSHSARSHWASAAAGSSPGTTGTSAQIFQSQILKILSLMTEVGMIYVGQFLPLLLYRRWTESTTGGTTGVFSAICLIRSQLLFLESKYSKSSQGTSQLFLKKTFKMKSMTERTISWFLCWLDEPSRLNAQQNWFFSIWFSHYWPLENVQFSFERREERGLPELFFHFFFTKWPSSSWLSGKYQFFLRSLEINLINVFVSKNNARVWHARL